MKGLFYVLAAHMKWPVRGVLVISSAPCRLLDGEPSEDTRKAEMAVMQLLEATEPAQRKRAADGSWRPSQGSAPFNIHAPREAGLRMALLHLYHLYPSSSPPPMSLIRHPQVELCTIWCINMPMSCTVFGPPLMTTGVSWN